MISENSKNFLKLLYFSSSGKKQKIDVKNITKFIPICKKSRVTSLLYYGLELLENNDLSNEEITALKNDTIRLGIINLHQDISFKDFINRSNDVKIPVIAFKGYVIKNIYFKPEMRAMGDIDLIVDSKDYAKVKRIILNDLDCKLLDEDSSELCATNKQGVTLELHQHLATELSNNQKFFDKTYKNNLILQDNYYTFNPNYHFVYMMDHIYKHFVVGGLGLKYLYDFVLYVEKYPNIIKETLSDLKKLNLDKLTLGFLQICNDYLDVNFKEQLSLFNKRIDEKALDSLLELMILYGEYGTIESRVNAKKVHGTFFKRMIYRLFPMLIRPCPYEKYKFVYNIKEIIIYPFRLIFHWITLLFDLRYIFNVFKNYSKSNKNKEENLSIMYKEMK